MSKQIIPTEEHYIGRVTWRGQKNMAKLKEQFEKLKLLERAKKEGPFKQFFVAPSMQFSGVIIHQLLLRKLNSTLSDVILFKIGGKELRFGINEYAIITGLHFGNYPKKGIPQSRTLVERYFYDDETVKSHELESVFLACTDTKDAWKLGMIYFVDAVLFSGDPSAKVDMQLFDIVENENIFLNYPFGTVSFEKTLAGIDKDIVRLGRNFLLSKEKVNSSPPAKKYIPKYTVCGYALALQYWAYEAIVPFGPKFAIKSKVKFPRMLSWSSTVAPLNKDVAAELNRKLLYVKPMLNLTAEEKHLVDLDVDEPKAKDKENNKTARIAGLLEGYNTPTDDMAATTPPTGIATASVHAPSGHGSFISTTQWDMMAANVTILKAGQETLKANIEMLKVGQEILKTNQVEMLHKLDKLVRMRKRKEPDADPEATKFKA